MGEILKLITLNNEENQSSDQPRQICQSHFPFRICDTPLPQCNTGFVYMLLSIRRQTYCYIGETKCLRTRLRQHNSGYGSSSTEPSYLRPFAVMAYICGFNNQETLRLYIERKWKEKINYLKRNGINDNRQWARSGNDIIQNINEDSFNIEKHELRLVLLFKN